MTTDISKAQTKTLKSIIAGGTDVSSYNKLTVNALWRRDWVRFSKNGGKVTATAKGRKALN